MPPSQSYYTTEVRAILNLSGSETANLLREQGKIRTSLEAWFVLGLAANIDGIEVIFDL